MFARTRTIAAQLPAPSAVPAPTASARARAFARRLLLHAALLALAGVAFVAYEHLKLQGESTGSLVALGAAAGLALSPVRALAHEVLAIEGALLHLVHGLGGLAIGGLTLTGVVSGRPVLDRAALAPFAVMGAAQALMHEPRNPDQAAAVRRFVASLPEARHLGRGGALDSPAQVRQSVAVVADLVAKAQALGETELRSDPAFQGALRRTMLRTGVSLGLDTIDEAIGRLAENPAAASAVPDLRRRLAAARRALDPDAPAPRRAGTPPPVRSRAAPAGAER